MWSRLSRWLRREEPEVEVEDEVEDEEEREEDAAPEVEDGDPEDDVATEVEEMPDLDLATLSLIGWDATLAPIPDEDLGLLLAAATRQARADPTPAAVRALATLRSALLTRGGDAVGLVLPHLLDATAEVAAAAGDHPVRLEALRAHRQLRDHRGQAERAHELTLALALALAEGGEGEEAERAWKDAMERARAMGRGKDKSPEARDRLSRSLRALGEHLLGTGRAEEAAVYLEGAVDTARDGGVRARAQVAWAALLLDLERVDEARPLLHEALGALPPEETLRARALLDRLATALP